MGVRFCPRCGTQRWPEARFCSGCGFTYGDLEPTTTATDATPQPGPAEAPGSPTPGSRAPGSPEVGSPEADGSRSDSGWTGPGWSNQELIDAIHASNGRTRRLASLSFALGGMILVSVATVAAAFGLPRPASGFIPLSTLQDAFARPADYVPLVVALAAATVGLAVAELFASRTVKPAVAVRVLLIAGLIVGGVGVALLGRIGYDAAGAILPGPIVLISGAAATLSAALVTAVIRD
ncbi:MAG: zinc ribbon domain-containing protein [Chloroflexota bacterium]